MPDPGRAARTRRLIVTGLVVATVVGALAVFHGSWRRKPPNLVLISIDTLRPDHLGTYGYFRDTSPTLTEVARDGVRFTGAFAQAPWTVPSHASMLTGRYPCAHGAAEGHAIAPTIPLLAERLRAAGYRTAGFVENPYLGRKYGFGRGFEAYEIDLPGNLSKYGRLISWLGKQRNSPFFLFYHTNRVHGPYTAPQDIAQKYADEEGPTVGPDPAITFLRRVGYHRKFFPLDQYTTLEQVVAAYDAGIRHVDDELSLLVALITSLGLYDDSVIVVTSDHGESLFDHGISIGHGLFLYDEDIRVPLVVKPARLRPKRDTIDVLVQSVDILPTVLELLGQRAPEDVDGQSLAGLIRTGVSPRDGGLAVGMSSNMGGMPYIRSGHWKYIGSARYKRKQILEWHLLSNVHSEVARRLVVRPQLFDLASDPDERVNLITDRPEVAAEMRARLNAILARCARPSRGEAAEVHLNEPEREQLRALGYVN